MSTKKRGTGAHYVNNKLFLEAMIEYKDKVKLSIENSTRKPQISNYIGNCILLIAQRVAHKPNFSNYTFREEMISDGIENCIMYIDNFNPEKSSNPFAYFSQIIHFAFIRRIVKERKQQYIKIKNMQNSFIFGDIQEHMASYDSEMGNPSSNLFDNEITSEFIRSFEQSLEKKKEIKPKQGIENFIEEKVDNPEEV
jgi:hypothetical protein